MPDKITLKSSDPRGLEQLDQTLAMIRDKTAGGKFTWEAEAVKTDKDGSMLFTLELNAKEQPKTPP